MSLAREDIKKLFLGSLAVAGALYAYSAYLIGPMGTKITSANAAVAQLGPEIDAARRMIADTRTLEDKAPQATATFEEIKSLIPAGAPVAWFPPRIVEFLRRQGVEAVSVRLDNEAPLPDLPGFRRLQWTIELPRIEFIPLAIAISGLENEEQLLAIQAVRINSSATDLQHPSATITAFTIITK